MKIIFSRKGFDSGIGRAPSAIVDGRPRSFPIPADANYDFTYGDLLNDLAELIEELTDCKRTTPCHLDPDLEAAARPRQPGWRGAFGQIGGAQGHLHKCNVEKGDLFLFWGWFQPVVCDGRWKYVGSSEHSIFGWMQIGDVCPIGDDPSHALAHYPWLSDHPHVRARDWPPSNTIYVAAEELTIPGLSSTTPGWGTFRKAYRLTAPERPRSYWRLPNWLNPKCKGTGLSRTSDSRWSADGIVRIGPGQEFVADVGDCSKAVGWLNTLFRDFAAD